MTGCDKVIVNELRDPLQSTLTQLQQQRQSIQQHYDNTRKSLDQHQHRHSRQAEIQIQINAWETIQRVQQQLQLLTQPQSTAQSSKGGTTESSSVVKQLERVGLEFNQLHYYVQRSAAGLPQQLRDVSV